MALGLLHTKPFTPDFTGYPVHMWVYKYWVAAMYAKPNQGHFPRLNFAKN